MMSGGSHQQQHPQDRERGFRLPPLESLHHQRNSPPHGQSQRPPAYPAKSSVAEASHHGYAHSRPTPPPMYHHHHHHHQSSLSVSVSLPSFASLGHSSSNRSIHHPSLDSQLGPSTTTNNNNRGTGSPASGGQTSQPSQPGSPSDAKRSSGQAHSERGYYNGSSNLGELRLNVEPN